MGFRHGVVMVVLIVCYLVHTVSSAETIWQVEVEALKTFKTLIRPNTVEVLADWNDETHHCNWTGIVCDPLSNRVIAISVPDRQLTGKISPSLGNISNLQVLNLSSNSLTGSIPNQLGRNLGLTDLLLDDNLLSGSIPMELGYLRNLQHLALGVNLLNGSIPDHICNCTSLSVLAVVLNNLTGTIPSCIGNLKNLAFFIVGVNQMSGAIPQDLYNCTNLRSLDLSQNDFTGPLKPSIGRLFRLRTLQFHSNSFSGIIPGEIGNLSQLISLELGRNRFSGQIPSEISKLSFLQGLVLAENLLEGLIPAKISEAKQLVELQLQLNKLTGSIPEDLSALEWISYLDLHGNNLNGSIPRKLSNLTRLIKVDFSHNHLTGVIPGAVLTTMKNMQIYLNLSNNILSGSIPEEIGELEMVQGIDISNNNLSGRIPYTLRGCKNLLLLDLSRNALSNQIPGDIFSKLDLLTSLNLSRNSLFGELPVNLAKLQHLSSLDLSQNNLSGSIPSSFTNFINLEHLNLSFNQLEGPVPTTGIFRNLTLSSLIGNPALCGNNLLRQCNREEQSTASRRLPKNSDSILKFIVSVIAFILLVCALLLFGRFFRNQNTDTTHIVEPYSFLAVLKKYNQTDLEIGTNSFSEYNVIGRGRLSTVYKGLVDDRIVAVKKLNSVQFSTDFKKSFERELHNLRFLKHRNLVKMIGYGRETGKVTTLVLEYMENGSLESIIHDPGIDMARWTFSERLRVCVSIANVLVYLHSDHGTPIVHCDLKPSNILFNGDWEAYLSNFRNAQYLDFRQWSTSGSEVEGTIGCSTQASTLNFTTEDEVCSFGMLVMEFLTTRRPTETIEDNGCRITLRQFVEAALTNGGFSRLLQLVDPDFSLSVSRQQEEERMIDLLELALSCTHPSPSNRPDMNKVLSSLLTIRAF